METFFSYPKDVKRFTKVCMHCLFEKRILGSEDSLIVKVLTLEFDS